MSKPSASPQLLERIHQDGETLEIWQDQYTRWLSFGGNAVESAYELDDPHKLVLPYTRAMLAALLFQPKPRQVLMLGMAGGALPRWLSAQYPGIQITCVEKSTGVNELCKRWFPPQKPTDLWTLHIDDAAHFVARNHEQFDLILVDVSEDQHSPSFLSEVAFLEHCRQRLSDQGIMAINLLFTKPDSLRHHLSQLRRTFPSKTAMLDVPKHQNLISLAAAGNTRSLSPRELKGDKKQLTAHSNLPYDAFVESLLRLNPANSGLVGSELIHS